MKEIKSEDRRVANIYKEAFKPFLGPNGEDRGEEALQINAHDKLGVGFHVYRMAPGTTTIAHEHTDHEEFLILEGELTDNDGYTYRKGDLVWLRKGTQHSSHTKDGALLAVYIGEPERQLDTA